MNNTPKADLKIPPRPNPKFSSINEFTLGEELGEGAIASVFFATHNPTGKTYAVKDVEITTLSEQDFENVEKELEIHSQLSHPYIIKMHDFFKENGHVYIVLDLAKNGNLFKHLTKNNPLDSNDIGRFWTQTAKAIQYLHSKQILMRDLKPENLLLDENMNIKVCDFGWATKMDDYEYKKLQGGTFAYMSPETLEGKEQGPGSDVWSLGILLFELYHNREPFTPGDNCEEQLYFLKIGRVVYKMGLDRIVSDIIEKLLKKDATKRITLEKVFQDPFTVPYIKSLESGPVASSNTQTSQPKPLKRQPSIQKSLGSQLLQKPQVTSNIHSYQNSMRSGYEMNHMSKATTSINKSSNSFKNSHTISNNLNGQRNQLSQNQGNVVMSTSYNQNLSSVQSNNRLINQNKIQSGVSYQPVQRNQQISRQNLQNNKISVQQTPVKTSGPTTMRKKQKSIKDIISYYQNKTQTNTSTSKPVSRLEVMNPSSNSKKVEITRSYTDYQNGMTNTLTHSKNNGIISYEKSNATRQVQKTYQPYMKSHAQISREKVIKPKSRVIHHHKTNSMDVQSLQNSLNIGFNQRGATYQQESRTLTPIMKSNQKRVIGKTVEARENSKNTKINLDRYNVMRASKWTPGYSKEFVRSYKPIIQTKNVSNKMALARGMTKNRSYNDLHTYKRLMGENPVRTIQPNNYSQKFKKMGSHNVGNKVMTSNEYGLTNSKLQVNGTRQVGMKKQRSVRKINLASYNKSYGLLK